MLVKNDFAQDPWRCFLYQRSTSSWCNTKASHDHRDQVYLKRSTNLRRFCMKLRFLIGGRTCLEGWPDKSGNPYWNPVRRAGHVRGPKPDSPVCQTGYSGFVRTDHWSRIQILEYFLLKANTIFLTGDKSFQFIHLWTWFDDLTWDKNIQGIWFKRQEVYGLERHLFTNG